MTKDVLNTIKNLSYEQENFSQLVYEFYHNPETKNLITERVVVIMENVIHDLIYKYNPNMDRFVHDELVNECMFVMLKYALPNYNPNCGAMFTTYCSRNYFKHAIYEGYCQIVYGHFAYHHYKNGIQQISYEDYMYNDSSCTEDVCDTVTESMEE